MPAYTAPSAALTASEKTRVPAARSRPSCARRRVSAALPFSQPGINGVGVVRIDRQTLRPTAFQEALDRPVVVRLVEADDAVAGGGVKAHHLRQRRFLPTGAVDS